MKNVHYFREKRYRNKGIYTTILGICSFIFCGLLFIDKPSLFGAILTVISFACSFITFSLTIKSNIRLRGLK